MSLESFAGFDSGEPMSASAFEALKEKMKAASAQMAAIRKEEKKQKKPEDELIKILSNFIQTSQKKQLVLLISRVLEKNIPANFVIAIILLSNEEIKSQVGTQFTLPLPEDGQKPTADEQSLIFFTDKDDTVSLKSKITLDNWIKTLMIQAEERPQKLLKNAYEYDEDKNRSITHPLIRLTAYIVEEFSEQTHISTQDLNLNEFAEFLLTGILHKTQENLDNRRNLEGDVSDPI